MKKSRAIIFIISFVLILCLCACSNNNADGPVITDEPNTVTQGNTNVMEETAAVPEETEAPETTATETEAPATTVPVTEPPVTTTAPASETPATEVKEDFEVSPASGTKYAVDSVNVRTGPGTNYGRVGHLDKGEAVEITGLCENGWYRIEFEGGEYFVSGSYLADEMTDTGDDNIDLTGDEGVEIQLPDGNVWEISNVTKIVYDPGIPGQATGEVTSAEEISEVLEMLAEAEYVEPLGGPGWVGGPVILFYSGDELVFRLAFAEGELWNLNEWDGVYAVENAWSDEQWRKFFSMPDTSAY